MDESCTVQAQPLGCIKNAWQTKILLRKKSLTFWGHIKNGLFLIVPSGQKLTAGHNKKKHHFLKQVLNRCRQGKHREAGAKRAWGSAPGFCWLSKNVMPYHSIPFYSTQHGREFFAGRRQGDCLSRIFRASFPAEFFLTECGHIREIGHGCPI